MFLVVQLRQLQISFLEKIKSLQRMIDNIRRYLLLPHLLEVFASLLS